MAPDCHGLPGKDPQRRFIKANFFNAERDAFQVKLKARRTGTGEDRATALRRDRDALLQDVGHGNRPIGRSELTTFFEGPQ
jgi:hypothetical protein